MLLPLAAGVAAQATAPAAPVAAAPTYQLDAGHTFVHWEVLHMGTSTTRGRFDRVSGVVQFDAARQQVDVSITADTGSVSTGLEAFDKVMRGAPLLSTTAHPAAYFTARRGRWEGAELRELQGEITLRGISQPLTLRALRFKCGLNPLFRREVCGGDFEAVIKRSDFGMTLALPLVADDVRLLVQVEGVRAE
jgi:polyisoprenoid-binding protein YceI